MFAFFYGLTVCKVAVHRTHTRHQRARCARCAGAAAGDFRGPLPTTAQTTQCTCTVPDLSLSLSLTSTR